MLRLKRLSEGDGFKVLGLEREGEADFLLTGSEIDALLVPRDGDGDGDEVIFFFTVSGFVSRPPMPFVAGGLRIEVGEEGIPLPRDEVCKLVETRGSAGDGGVFLEGLVLESFEGLSPATVGLVLLR